jgi:hypothetical protein
MCAWRETMTDIPDLMGRFLKSLERDLVRLEADIEESNL